MAQNNTAILSFVRGEKLKTLTNLNPIKSVSAIFFEWLLIAFAIAIHIIFPHPLVYFLSWFIIATRLYAFYSLIHDAIHFLIVKNRKLNDLIAQVCLGLPLFISIKNMRKAHMAHHKYLQTENDPEMKHLEYKEFQYPKSKSNLIKLFLLDILGINLIYYQVLRLKSIVTDFKPSKFNKSKTKLFIFYCVAFGLIIYFAGLKALLLYWLIPYATLYQVINRLRLSTEHFNLGDSNETNTRSVVPNFIERWTLTPYNLGYHMEHHLYPAVPFYNLPKLHQMLMDYPTYNNQVIVEKSYLQVIKKMHEINGD